MPGKIINPSFQMRWYP